MTENTQLLCRSGHVGGFDVFLKGNLIVVMEPGGGPLHKHPVGGLASWMKRFTEIRLLHYTLPDGDRVIAVYAPQDKGFGYAFNIDCDWCSEWGYLPVPDSGARAQNEVKPPLEQET